MSSGYERISFIPVAARPLVCPDCSRDQFHHLVHMYELIPRISTKDGCTALAMGLCTKKSLWILQTDHGYIGQSDGNRRTTEVEYLGDAEGDES